MAIYDSPDQSPLQDLIPAVSAYPLLLQIIIANSAVHVFNISRDPIDASVYQEAKRPCLVAYYTAVSRYGGPITTSYVSFGYRYQARTFTNYISQHDRGTL